MVTGGWNTHRRWCNAKSGLERGEMMYALARSKELEFKVKLGS